jgi:hypothetical protein
MPTDAIECPLCLGEGKLKRTEVWDRLGAKDFARVAQLSAEEAFPLLQKQNHDEQAVWARFETELTKRTAEIERRHGDQLQPLVVRIKELESAASISVELKTIQKGCWQTDGPRKLDRASIDTNISPFAAFVTERVRCRGKPRAKKPHRAQSKDEGSPLTSAALRES